MRKKIKRKRGERGKGEKGKREGGEGGSEEEIHNINNIHVCVHVCCT